MEEKKGRAARSMRAKSRGHFYGAVIIVSRSRGPSRVIQVKSIREEGDGKLWEFRAGRGRKVEAVASEGEMWALSVSCKYQVVAVGVEW